MHRVGRTGRAGQKGAIRMCIEVEKDNFRTIFHLMILGGRAICYWFVE